MSSSWKLDASTTTHEPGSTAPSSSESATPTLPATGAPSIAPSSSLVVVLPFVPVTATSGFSRMREPSSSSLQTGIPAEARLGDEDRLGRHARALDEQLHPVEQRDVVVVPELAVRADDAHAAPLERSARRLPRAREAEHERAPGERHRRRSGRNSKKKR